MKRKYQRDQTLNRVRVEANIDAIEKQKREEIMKQCDFYNMAYCLSHTVSRKQFRDNVDKMEMLFS